MGQHFLTRIIDDSYIKLAGIMWILDFEPPDVVLKKQSDTPKVRMCANPSDLVRL